jgi:hypothetical protein
MRITDPQCLSSCNNYRSDERIFMIFNIVNTVKFCENRTAIRGILHEDLHAFLRVSQA